MPDDHEILQQFIFTQFNLTDAIPIPYIVLNFIFNGDIENTIDDVLNCLEYSKLLSLNNYARKCYILLFSKYINEIPEELIFESFDYITIEELHLIPQYVDRFFDYQLNLFKKNKDYVYKDQLLNIKEIISNPYMFADKLPDYIRFNKYVLSQVCTKNYWALKYTSEEIKNDKNIVTIACLNSPCALEYASDELKQDKKFIRILLKNRVHVNVLNYVNPKILDDEKIVILACSQDELYFVHVCEKLRYDKEFIIKLLIESKNPKILRYVSSNFLKDREFIKCLCIIYTGNFNIFYWAPMDVLEDEEIITLACLKNYEYFKYASINLKNNKEFIKKLLLTTNISSEFLAYVSKEIRSDEEIFNIRLKKIIILFYIQIGYKMI